MLSIFSGCTQPGLYCSHIHPLPVPAAGCLMHILSIWIWCYIHGFRLGELFCPSTICCCFSRMLGINEPHVRPTHTDLFLNCSWVFKENLTHSPILSHFIFMPTHRPKPWPHVHPSRISGSPEEISLHLAKTSICTQGWTFQNLVVKGQGHSDLFILMNAISWQRHTTASQLFLVFLGATFLSGPKLSYES